MAAEIPHVAQVKSKAFLIDTIYTYNDRRSIQTHDITSSANADSCAINLTEIKIPLPTITNTNMT